MMFIIVALLSSLPAVGVTGESDVIGSDKPVTVTVGDNAILPCHLEPPFNVRTLTVEWKRDGEYVHVYRSRKDDPGSQDKNFRGRTSLFHEEMMRGNISLKLTNVTELDAGSYTCFVSKLQKQVRRGFINLTVEPVENRNKGGQTDDTNTESGGAGTSAIIVAIVVAVIAIVVAVAVWKNRRKIIDMCSGGRGANAGANVGANAGANVGANAGANVGANARANAGTNISLLNRNSTTDCKT